MQLAIHREEELGGPLGHLTDLGVPQQPAELLWGPCCKRVKNTVLKAAAKTKTMTGDACYNMCAEGLQVRGDNRH